MRRIIPISERPARSLKDPDSVSSITRGRRARSSLGSNSRSEEKAILRFLIFLTSIHLLCGAGSAAPPFELWTFDNTSTIGGHRVVVVGHPRVIATPWG